MNNTKFKVGDKAFKPKGYAFPCTIVGVFETLKGEIRVVGEMDEYGLLHIFNEGQLEHVNPENMGKEQNVRILTDLLEYLKEQHSNLPTHVFEVLGEVIDDLKQK